MKIMKLALAIKLRYAYYVINMIIDFTNINKNCSGWKQFTAMSIKRLTYIAQYLEKLLTF